MKSEFKHNRTNVEQYNTYIANAAAMADEAKRRQAKAIIDENVKAFNEKYARLFASEELYTPEMRDKISRATGRALIGVAAFNAKSALSVALGITRKVVEAGGCSVNNIQSYSFYEGVSNINGMFSSKEWKERNFSKRNKIIIITDLSKQVANCAMRDEQKFWNELLAYASSEGRKAILCYNLENSETLEEATLSSIPALNEALISAFSMIQLKQTDIKGKNK